MNRSDVNVVYEEIKRKNRSRKWLDLIWSTSFLRRTTRKILLILLILLILRKSPAQLGQRRRRASLQNYRNSKQSETPCSIGWRVRKPNLRMHAAAPAKSSRIFVTMRPADAIKALLPVLDSFDRALQVKSDPGDFRGGVDLIYKQLQDALAKLGVRAIPAKGEPFDPRVHEAIEMVETSDAPDHEVLEELQRGYKIKDRLLRPAMVKVAKNS